jgi:hypothetical protein
MVQTPNDGAKTHYSKDIGAVRELIRNDCLRAIVSTAGALLFRTDPVPTRKRTAVPPRSLPTSRSEKAAGQGPDDLPEQAPLPTAEERNLGADMKPRNTVLQYGLVTQGAVTVN